MSKLPLMHSISTVGVIKHYNQDYLLHHTRTDFTGKNGIGKSLIADLLQILFIADSKKITFGTDSVKKEDRQIFTIPYKTNDAYFFMNIEIEPKQYITIGVNIPSTSSSPIRMFRILNTYYNPEVEQRKNITERKKLTGYLIPEQKLPYHKDFLITKNNKTEIPKIGDLVSHLRDSKDLYLSYFSTKAEKKEQYQFLFDKNILPLNLSIDNHLTAFAKVLQAFSKANTLDTDKDKSLKSFLFDDKKEEIETEYKRNKERLDNLVIRHRKLKKVTDDLKLKRVFLEDLKQKEEAYITAEKLAFKKEYFTKKKNYKTVVDQWDKDEKKHKALNKQIANLKAKLPTLEKTEAEANKKQKNYSKSLQDLNNYKDEYSTYLKKKDKIDKLEACPLPDVSKEEKEPFDFENESIDNIISTVEFFKPVWKKYGSIQGIENQYKQQSAKLDEVKTSLKQEQNRLEQMQRLVNYKNEETLASQIIKKKKALSKAQETILLALFMDVKWQKPTNITNKLTYTDSLDILNESNIIEDKVDGGYWIKIGSLNYFAYFNKEKQIFKDPKNLQNAFNQKEQEINKALEKLKNRINDIENLKIDNILQHLPNISFKWDKDIPDRRKIDDYKTAVALVKNIPTFKTTLKAELTKLKTSLTTSKSKIGFEFPDKEIVETIEQYSTKQSVFMEAYTNALKIRVETEADIKVKEQSISELNFDADKIQKEKEELKKEIEDFKKCKEKKYPLLFSGFNAEEVALLNTKDVENDCSLKKSLYQIRYEDVLKDFQYTNDEIEIKEQIENKTFHFKQLERKLLGNTIVETKNIEQALNSANEEKRKMSSTLRGIMLKIFQKTQDEFETYKSVITRLNLFFKNKLISEKYYFQVRFDINPNFSIQWINELQSNAQTAGETGELFESESVEQFAETFFKDVSGYKKGIAFSELLDPKTYFTLKTEFKDEDDNKSPGSTGESYTARVLLGIGRLSITSKEKREGLNFLILEEVASLDPSNFNTFPELAEQFGYQIITMTPKPYGSNSDDGWYLHQLIPGKINKDINSKVPNSSFKTNFSNEQLLAYLERNKN
ncbi:hypothetical protein C1H87_00865 [Flavivirga eckloniae]|uniref:MukB N-terminal domain-containing protein n=2 Tax=Flavivirga eckloniae TaxID=1803846 RepID=A0A2K9PJZ2_9FLAO|nr:hypothetical protein C1H87_00865 [Flavivirga eckloniae]